MEKVLAEKPLNTQPWFMHWVFQAIDHAGLFDNYGAAQLRRWQIVPENIGEILKHPSAMAAMMKMVKFDIAALEAAAKE